MTNFSGILGTRLDLSGEVCLFGIGVSLHECFNQLVQLLGRVPDHLCDNDSMKWEDTFFGVVCISPEKLLAISPNVSVIVTVRKYEAVYGQLRRLGFKNIYVACFDRGYELVSAIKEIKEPAASDAESAMQSVQGKCTLVTGASRGIGRQIAIEMAKLGSNLILHSRRKESTAEVASICTRYGVKVHTVAADLARGEELEALLDELNSREQMIDCIFNNAAISLPCGSDPWNISPQDYLDHFAVNTIAPVRICYRLIPAMIKQGFGRVVNVTSTIQKRPAEMAYACSKAALNKFVHDFVPSLEDTGVMMSLVCPGHVQSDMGGEVAPHPVDSVVPGVLLGVLMPGNINGCFFIAQDYAGMDIQSAMCKAKFYYGI